MTFPKRTFEKPIPISPTIALDRERCILCYRCTRFSEDVSEDGQLVAREPRRAVDDRHLRGPAVPRAVLGQRHRALPGRRAHVDPVPVRGAAVGDPERPHRLRAVPGRLQHQATTREGKVKRILLAQPPGDRRGLALRQGPLRASRTCAPATASPTRAARSAARRYETLSWDDALDEAEELLRAGGASIVTALSGSETIEQAYALGKLLRQGLGAHCAVLPEDVSPALDAFRLPLSAIRDAELIVVLGDDRSSSARRSSISGSRPRAAQAPRSSRARSASRGGGVAGVARASSASASAPPSARS